MKRIRTLEDLLLSRLEDIHVTNTQSRIMLPLISQRVQNPDLRDRLRKYFYRSVKQNERIAAILVFIGWKELDGPHNAAGGIMEDLTELIESDNMEPSVLDAALLATVQRLQHHHIATYGCLRDWSKQLGYDEASKTLQECLDEEIIADFELSELANTTINRQAADLFAAAAI